MRGSVSSGSPESPANKQFTAVSAAKARLSKSQRLSLISLIAFGLFIAPAIALIMSTRTGRAEGNQGHAEQKSSIDIKTTGLPADAAIGGSVAAPGSGSAVHVNVQSSSSSSSSGGQNSSSTTLNVNGEDIPVDSNGNVEKTIHSTGPNASVNVTIDSQNSTEGESGDSL